MTVKLEGNEFSIFPFVSQYPGRHWLKRGQKIVNKVDFTHAGIGFRVKAAGIIPLLYESTGRGVDVDHWDKFVARREVKHMWEVKLTPGKFNEFVNECFHENGKNYSTKQLFVMSLLKGIEWLFKVLGINKLRKKFGREDAKWWFGKEPFRFKRYPKWLRPNREREDVCSETAGRMLQKHSPIGRDLKMIPSELAGKMMQKHAPLYSVIEDDGLIAGIDPDLFSPVDFFNYCEGLEKLGQATKVFPSQTQEIASATNSFDFGAV